MTRNKTLTFLLAVWVWALSSCAPAADKRVLVKPPVPTKILIKDTVLVTSVPDSLGYDPFYKKYVDAGGIPVVSSAKVPDKALVQARNIVIQMLARIPQVNHKLIENKIRVAVMSRYELTTDIPEHRDLNKAFPGTNWDTRARGLGATLVRPAISCAEENLLCYPKDPYQGEDILIHEFAHTIHQLGIAYLDKEFNGNLERIYRKAKSRGLWKDTYAISNVAEYFAEGVQCWFNVNLEASPANGVHNEINTRKELQEYDPLLFKLIGTYFYADDERVSCQ